MKDLVSSKRPGFRGAPTMATAIDAIAVGAFAIGAWAVGRLAIRRFSVEAPNSSLSRFGTLP